MKMKPGIYCPRFMEENLDVESLPLLFFSTPVADVGFTMIYTVCFTPPLSSPSHTSSHSLNTLSVYFSAFRLHLAYFRMCDLFLFLGALLQKQVQNSRVLLTINDITFKNATQKRYIYSYFYFTVFNAL